jgi:hypothetical protein
MGKVRDFGRDPLPGSGVFLVKSLKNGKVLGKVKAKDLDEAVKKVRESLPAAYKSGFVVSEIPLGG